VKDMFSVLESNDSIFKLVKGFVWFNVKKESEDPNADYRVDSSAESK